MGTDDELWGIRSDAARLDRHAAVAAALFEVAGIWSAGSIGASAKVLLAVHSRHLGWQAQLWSSLRPVLWDEEPTAHTGDPGADDVAAPLVVSLMELRAESSRLEALYRCVLPALADSYVDHRSLLMPPSGRHLERWIEIAVRDLRADIAEGADLAEAAARDTPAIHAEEASIETVRSLVRGMTSHPAVP